MENHNCTALNSACILNQQLAALSKCSGGSRILKRGRGNDISKVDLRILDSGGGEALEG